MIIAYYFKMSNKKYNFVKYFIIFIQQFQAHTIPMRSVSFGFTEEICFYFSTYERPLT